MVASITIRNLGEDLKQRLRLRAAQHARSMEEEAREILRASLSRQRHAPANLADAIRRRFKDVGGVELELPARDAIRPPPSLSEE